MDAICENPTVGYVWVTVGLMIILLGGLLFSTPSSSVRSGRTLSIKLSNFAYRGPATLLLVVVGSALILALARIYALCSSAPPAAGNTFVTVNTNVSVQQKLDEGIKTQTYQESRLPSNEIVQNRNGGYYLIDLRDPVTGDSIFFDLGKYTKDILSASFRRSWADVEKDIVGPLRHSGVPYKVFVAGSADTIGSKAQRLGFLIGHSPKQITVFPRSPENPDIFVPEPRTMVIPEDYDNRHLPNLRAAFIQERLRDVGVDATILDGSVRPSSDGKDRNVAILLYLPVRQPSS